MLGNFEIHVDFLLNNFLVFFLWLKNPLQFFTILFNRLFRNFGHLVNVLQCLVNLAYIFVSLFDVILLINHVSYIHFFLSLHQPLFQIAYLRFSFLVKNIAFYLRVLFYRFQILFELSFMSNDLRVQSSDLFKLFFLQVLFWKSYFDLLEDSQIIKTGVPFSVYFSHLFGCRLIVFKFF